MIHTTVPVESAYQVFRVAKVLSTGKVAPYMCWLRSIENEIKAREIFEKIDFYWTDPQTHIFTHIPRSLRAIQGFLTALEGLKTYVRCVIRGKS